MALQCPKLQKTKNHISSERRRKIGEIDQYLKEFRQTFDATLETLGWKEDELKNKPAVTMAVCPLNKNHIMPESSLKKHFDCCEWIQAGYTREEFQNSLPSSHFYYKNSTSVVPVLIDKKLQTEILNKARIAECGEYAPALVAEKDVPKTMERSKIELTPNERLAIYNYIIERTKATNKLPQVTMADLMTSFDDKNFNNEQKLPVSLLEHLAKMRDYKRRRQSYRAKNVHVTKKSYTEILRETIQNQTEFLERFLSDIAGSECMGSPRPNSVSDLRDQESRTSHTQSVSPNRDSRERSVEMRRNRDSRERSVEKRRHRDSRERSVEKRRNRDSRERSVEKRRNRDSRERSVEMRRNRNSRERSVEMRNRKSRERSVEMRRNKKSRERSVEVRKSRKRSSHHEEYQRKRRRKHKKHKKHKRKHSSEDRDNGEADRHGRKKKRHRHDSEEIHRHSSDETKGHSSDETKGHSSDETKGQSSDETKGQSSDETKGHSSDETKGHSNEETKRHDDEETQ